MKEVSCSDYQRLVDDIGDVDRLPAGASRHGDGCESCARFGRELLALRALLKEPARVPAPADFDARVARAIRARSSERPPRPAWRLPLSAPMAAATAGIVLAAGAAVLSGLPGRDAAGPMDQPAPVDIAVNGRDDAPTEPTEPTATASDDVAFALDRVDAPPAVRASHRAVGSRPVAPRLRRAATMSGDATFLIGDAAGVRVVSVPRVIVGAQEILPASATPADEA